MGNGRLHTIWAALCAMSAACDDSAALPRVDASVADAAARTGTLGQLDAGLVQGGAGYGKSFGGGQFHLGPVDYDETQYHNACASEQKYQAAVRGAEGMLLAGVWSGLDLPEAYCDSCIQVNTAQGKTAVLRVVTYGDTSVNSIDVSSQAYALLNSGEFPRNMTWQQVRCPDTGRLIYEFKTGSNAYWTSFWVRNARLPIASVEVESLRHAFAPTTRDSDGSLVDNLGFGEGMFAIRVTAIDGQQIVDSFLQPTNGLPGALIEGQTNFE